MLLILIYVFTFIFFCKERGFLPFHAYITSSKVLGIFIGGFFYAYGFTAAPATAVLLILAKQQNIFGAAIIGGLGALISDVLIFLFIRHSFVDEIMLLKKEVVIEHIRAVRMKLFGRYNANLLPIISCILIASPLPTEFGVALLASLKNLAIKKFLIIAFLLHTIGILIILLIGTVT